MTTDVSARVSNVSTVNGYCTEETSFSSPIATAPAAVEASVDASIKAMHRRYGAPGTRPLRQALYTPPYRLGKTSIIAARQLACAAAVSSSCIPALSACLISCALTVP